MTAHLYSLTPGARKGTIKRRPVVEKYFGVNISDSELRLEASDCKMIEPINLQPFFKSLTSPSP